MRLKQKAQTLLLRKLRKNKTVDPAHRAVCEHCLVLCEVKYDDSFGGRMKWFECPVCGNGDPQTDVEECGMTDDELAASLQFQKFVRGIEDAPTEPELVRPKRRRPP